MAILALCHTYIGCGGLTIQSFFVQHNHMYSVGRSPAMLEVHSTTAVYSAADELLTGSKGEEGKEAVKYSNGHPAEK